MKSTFISYTLWIFLFATPLQAYIVLDSKTEVSPGCEGGVLSHKCTSFISNVNKLNESNSFDEEFEEVENSSDLDCSQQFSDN